MATKEEKVLEKRETITAVYKVNLHCEQCAREIKRPLLRTQGIYNVDTNLEKSEVKIKGRIDVIKIHKRIEKLSKRRVELISPEIDVKKSVAIEEKVTTEVKEAIVRTTKVKVHMHCDKCEHDLRNRLLRNKGIYIVKTNIQEESLTVEGTIEPEKLLSYIRRKVHKRAEIISSTEVKVEKNENEKEIVEFKASSSSEIVEFKEEMMVEAKNIEGNAPYFIHYAYAPQWFSDENPNACRIM